MLGSAGLEVARIEKPRKGPGRHRSNKADLAAIVDSIGFFSQRDTCLLTDKQILREFDI